MLMTATLGTGMTAGGRASQLVRHGFSAFVKKTVRTNDKERKRICLQIMIAKIRG